MLSGPTIEVPALPVGWSQISGSGIHLVLHRPSEDPLVAQLRAALPSERGPSHALLDELLDVLLKAGVRGLPDFVAVDEVDPVRVVVRGSAVAELTLAGEVHRVVSGGAPTWVDIEMSGSLELVRLSPSQVEAGSGVASAAPELPTWPDPAPIPGRPTPTPQSLVLPKARESPGSAASRIVSPPPDEHPEQPSYDDLFGSTQRALAFHAEDEPSTQRLTTEVPPPVEAPPAPPPVASELTLPPPVEGPPAIRGGSGGRVPPFPAGVPVRTSIPPPLIDSVPWAKPSSGASTPPAASNEPRPGSGVHSPPPVMSMPIPPAPATVRMKSPVPAAPRTAPGPTTAPPASVVPAARQGQEAAPGPAVPTYGLDDHGENDATVDRGALLAAARSQPAGPSVLAVLCPAGHPSPAHASHCRLCNRQIPRQEPYSTARPVLGVLRLSTGDVVKLDRGVLLGRAPRINGDPTGSERPHVLRLTSPDNDISRNHVEVLLEGWHVMVRDLGSTNGTTVALPGQEPIRLRPNDQQVIEPGTVVDLADEISFTYEVDS